jgi:hypothetical protein
MIHGRYMIDSSLRTVEWNYNKVIMIDQTKLLVHLNVIW